MPSYGRDEASPSNAQGPLRLAIGKTPNDGARRPVQRPLGPPPQLVLDLGSTERKTSIVPQAIGSKRDRAAARLFERWSNALAMIADQAADAYVAASARTPIA
jgi:hypothetical protein